jgi:hypothetical protein
MSDTQSGLPAAGWYPDPAGSNRTRWWDGARWTESFSAPASAPAASAAPVAQTPAATPAAPADGAAAAQPVAPDDVPAAPSASSDPYAQSTPYSAVTPAQPVAAPAAGVPTAAPYPGMSAYPSAAPYSGAPDVPTAPAGTSPYTPFIWALALLPLVNTVITLVQTVALQDTIDAATRAATDPTAVPPGPDLASYGLSFLLFAAAILLIVLDWRALNKASVPRPFHWAWGFFMIIGAPVYMIGRSIVVRRRTGSGLAPMFVNLGLIVVNFAIGITIAVVTFMTILENTPSL